MSRIRIVNTLGLADSQKIILRLYLNGKQPTNSRKMCVVIGQREMIEILNMDLEHLIQLLMEISVDSDLTSDLLHSVPVTIKKS